jgi:hypothetical protein
MAGVTSENVRAYRRRHSIGAEWRESRAAAPAPVAVAPAPAPVAAAPAPAPEAAPAPAPKATPAAGGLAFAVLVDGQDEPYVVFAADIAGAVAAAAARVSGRIDAVEYIGRALT